MSIVIPFPGQMKRKPPHSAESVKYEPDLPRAPWWREYTAKNNAEHLKRARAMVLEALSFYREDPRAWRRAALRDEVAGAVGDVALGTDMPLGVIMDALTPVAELTAEEMASPHDGLTPWRARILREAGGLREDAFWRRMRMGERHPGHRTFH